MADENYVRLGCTAEACTGVHKAKGYCLRHYRQWQRGGVKTDATNCAHCGDAFRPSVAGNVYCSKRCKLAAWKAANLERFKALPSNQRKVCAIHTGYCARCREPWVGRQPRKYCGPACQPKPPKPPYVSQAPAQKECKTCRAVFCPEFRMGPSAAFCSEDCRKQAAQSYKRASKIKRKAALRGARVETVDPFKVFDRDGWHCQLCGVQTPRAKRGTYEPDAPELDHIIPLSKGGEHSYRNTQCACRRCNGEKGDSIKGQMPRSDGEGGVRSLAPASL